MLTNTAGKGEGEEGEKELFFHVLREAIGLDMGNPARRILQ